MLPDGQATPETSSKAGPAAGDPAPRPPLVSILYLTYKHERFAEAARSVLEQTYKLLDIVILDDASPDGTADVIRREVRRHRRRSRRRWWGGPWLSRSSQSLRSKTSIRS
jgi:cellulose synthase/poly-beta-1,6-N-acetylglucosamine synthase-like glycosyltransferase